MVISQSGEGTNVCAVRSASLAAGPDSLPLHAKWPIVFRRPAAGVASPPSCSIVLLPSVWKEWLSRFQ